MSGGAVGPPRNGYELRAECVVAGYTKGVDIVRGASIDVAGGELVCVVGPNGAGKSTLVKAICGFVPVRSGGVFLDGADVTGLDADVLATRGVGYVPQVDDVFPTLSVQANLALGGYQSRSRRGLRDRIDETFEEFPELAPHRRRKANLLSGGQRRQLSLARALMPLPRLLVLDEPSAGLAPKMVNELFAKIEQVRAHGISILMVEQNARRALDIADRGFVLAQGRERAEGTGIDLLASPSVKELYLGVTD